MNYLTYPAPGYYEWELPDGQIVYYPTDEELARQRMEAQTTYTAMMTDTLIDAEIEDDEEIQNDMDQIDILEDDADESQD